MEARDIKRYLADLGAALKNRGVKKPLRMMLIGGAYMLLLENAPRSTEEIDIFWLEEDAFERMREVLSACMLARREKAYAAAQLVQLPHPGDPDAGYLHP